MALFRDWIFSTDFFAIFLLFLANLKGILEFFLEFMSLTRLSDLSFEVMLVVPPVEAEVVAVAEAVNVLVILFSEWKR